MIFRQFCTQGGELSYLLADPVTRQAALIDPSEELVAAYGAITRELGLKLTYLFETHLHEAHVSAAPQLRQRWGARLVMHNDIEGPCVDARVRTGDRLYVGEEQIKVLETPGHSRCSLSYLWRDRVFTGHSLLAGVAGPCRREDAEPARLFQSIHERLYVLPDETLVFPGHLWDGLRVSTIGQEKATNGELPRRASEADFVAMKQQQAAKAGVWQEDALGINRQCME